MNAVFFPGKIRIPLPPKNLVTRTVLLKKLAQTIHFPVVLVSAPAGFGKSSLAAEFIAQVKNGDVEKTLLVAWLAVDSEDNDPVRFWASIAASLHRSLSKDSTSDTPFLSLLDSLCSAQPPSIHEVSESVLYEAEQAHRQILLTIDDFHLLSSELVTNSFARFIEHLPENLHILLLTRKDPPLPLARLRARGHLAEFRADDLRFSLEESGNFMNKSLGKTLTGEQVAAIDRKTEGWAAGLQMAALSLARKSNEDSFIHSFSGSDRFVLEFLVEEVLLAQSTGLRDFLLDSALLDRFCAPLLDASIHPAGGSENMLRNLEGGNLFLVPLDDDGIWFRYHHLFSQALRARRKTIERPGEREILLGAASWYEQCDNPEKAAGILLQIGEKQKAAGILDKIAYSILARGERFTLETRIADLGPEIVLAHPELAQIAAWTQVFSGQGTRTDEFLSQLETSADRMPDGKDRRNVTGAVAVMRAFVAVQRGDVPLAEAKATESEKLLDSDRPFARNIIPFVRGSCLRMRARYPEAMIQVERFIAQAEAWGDIWNMMLAYYEGCLTARCMGNLQLAEDFYHRSMNELSRRGVSRFGSSCKIYGNYAEILYEKNELSDISSLLSDYVNGYDDWLLPTDLLVGFSPMIKLDIASGNLAGARDLLDRASRIEEKAGIFPRIRVLFRNLRIRYSIAAGKPELPQQPSFSPQLVSEAQSLEAGTIRYLNATGKFPDAAERAEKLSQEVSSSSALALFIECKALEAVALAGAGKTAAALDSLYQALVAAGENCFIRTFVDLGDEIRQLLAETEKRGITSPVIKKSVTRILSAFPESGCTEKMNSHVRVSEREIEVLALLAEGSSNREIAEALFISEGTVKTHVHHLAEKLDAKSRGTIVRNARHMGIL